MAYASWSVVFGEQPSAAKWNILGTNDSYFDTFIDRSGFPVQIKANSSSATTSSATVIPNDNTIPQITEGVEVMTQAITPTSASNLLVIEANALMGNSGVAAFAMALFQDATANALAVSSNYQSQSAGDCTLSIIYGMTAGTTSSTTFRIRIGANAGTTTFGNGHFSTAHHGGLKVTEYKV